MPSTESITLENWPGLTPTEIRRKSIYHFAIRQRSVNLDFHLAQFFRSEEVAFHFFDDFNSLLPICQRFPISSILIGGDSDFYRELEILQAIKQNAFLSIIPVIMYHPAPANPTVLAAYENQVDDFIYGEWLDRIVGARIRRAIDRSRRDLAINPSTQLPGPALIEEVIQRQLDMQADFAVCYADLDNFKAYNDYYGYSFGDRIIRLVGRIIRDVVFDVCREGFVGHIAGDDYIFVIPTDQVEQICTWVLKTFDSIIPYRYASVDRERGYIETKSRADKMEQYELLSMSIAVLLNQNGKFKHIGEMSKMLADLKKATKAHAGSNYMVERRAKY